ncbi:PIN domain-containing protein [Flavobacterium silvaticum]|uniref:DUF4935 domain-containing protein n=1 Tax=Flavobacterium silvaticum TaxID=1852020 RepID=A0A972FU41_9FLAO|nr:PIN domain-containing protein [Flavobacterium silvaticum]NMH28057.1 DUF4935 domain-containing protein [Flavobacterium silvaticum]
MELETDIIFLDTSIFEGDNFFRGHKIKKLGELSRDGEIKVKITSVTYDEVKNRMAKRLKEAKSTFSSISKEVESKAKILKNLDNYKDLFPFKRVDVDRELKVMVEKWDAWIVESKVEIIDSKIADITTILGQYWNQKPPFDEGQKKDEFPDAISINTIHNWARVNKAKVYVLSKDSDFWKYGSDENLVMLNDLSLYLGAVNTRIEGVLFIQSISKEVENNFSQVIKMLKDQYFEEVAELMNKELYEIYDDFELEEPELNDLELIQCVLFDASKENANGQLTIKLNIKILASFRDYGSSFYDKEDDVYYNVENKWTTIDANITFDVNAEFEYEMDDNDIINFDVTDLTEFSLLLYESNGDNEVFSSFDLEE